MRKAAQAARLGRLLPRKTNHRVTENAEKNASIRTDETRVVATHTTLFGFVVPVSSVTLWFRISSRGC